MKLCLTPLLALLPLFAACDGSRPPENTGPARTTTVTPAAMPASTAASASAASRAGAPSLTAAVSAPGGVQASVASTRLSDASAGASAVTSSLIVKRLVVTTGVKDREPVALGSALPADGSAVYAFVELANPVGPSEKLRITFERKGANEPVGNVTLPVPGNTSRHRTWAFTRFIRTPGQWDAVLWSEAGVELGRTSFEAGPS
jgi:hypothetical protein